MENQLGKLYYRHSLPLRERFQVVVQGEKTQGRTCLSLRRKDLRVWADKGKQMSQRRVPEKRDLQEKEMPRDLQKILEQYSEPPYEVSTQGQKKNHPAELMGTVPRFTQDPE